MKEVFEENSKQEGEMALNDEEKKLLIEKIKDDESLDPDTRNNAMTAVKLYSVDYDNAIKIAEVVNLLWEGKKRFDYNEDDIYVYKTHNRDGIFIEKLFSLAEKYKDIEAVDAIPNEVLEDVFEFKNNYRDELALDEIKKDDKKLKLYDFIIQKIKSLDYNLENNKDSEWKEIMEKLNLVNINITDLRGKKFIEVKVVKALIDYEEKQNNIQERKENGFGVRGFEKCDEFSNKDIRKFLNDNFSQELLAKSLVAEVVYSPKFRISGDWKFYEENEYLKAEKENPNIKDKVYRGSGSIGSVFASVVDIYNHKYGDISKYNYLNTYSENDKVKAYFLGTIVHETGGHHFYDRILKLSERKEYMNICQSEQQEKSVTYYVEKHKNGLFWGNIYAEDFSDSMRRFMSDYEVFKQEFPKRAEFIESKFPEIVKDGIRKFIENEQ